MDNKIWKININIR